MCNWDWFIELKVIRGSIFIFVLLETSSIANHLNKRLKHEKNNKLDSDSYYKYSLNVKVLKPPWRNPLKVNLGINYFLTAWRKTDFVDDSNIG